MRYISMKTASAVILASLVLATRTGALADTFVDLPREIEVELALSALPADLQHGATIYVRDPKKSFVLYRQGTNGWSTFVARTSARFYAAKWDYSYPDDQLIPIAFDRVGAEHHMVPYFDIEQMRVDGVSAAEAKRRIRQRFSDGTYTAPSDGGLSYMLAPIHRAYMDPAISDQVMTVSFPHYMPYAPNLQKDELGAMDPHRRSGTLDHGGADTGPHGYLYFMVQPDQAEAIRARYAELLGRLCEHHSNWCLPTA